MIDVLDRINQLKNERGWSNYRLAEEASLTQSALTNMFTRRTLPNLTSLNLICEAFGITLSEFFDEEKETMDEARLLSSFRQLSIEDKNTLIAISEVLKNKK